MRLLLSIVAGILLMSLAATAENKKVESKFTQGDCAGQAAGWWAVTTFVDGVPARIVGVNCAGASYDWDLTGNGGKKIVPSDPTGGQPPTFTGVCGSGAWYALVQADAGGMPVWMGGVGCDGQYYVIENLQEAAPGGDGNLN